MAFAVSPTARLPLGPPQRTGLHDDAYSGFTHVADRAIASAPLRTRPLDHARGHRYQGPRRLPGPDSHRQAIVNLSLLRHVVLHFLMAPKQSRRTATLQKRGGVIQVVVGARIHAVASAPPPLCSSSIKASVHTHRGARGAAFGRGPPLCYPRAAGTVRRPPGDLRGDRSGCRGTFSRVAHDAAGVVWVESWPGGQKRVSPSVGATDGAPVPRGVKRTNWILTVGLVFRSYRRYSVKRGGRVLVLNQA